MYNFKTIGEIDLTGKRVLVRADLNVPMKDGRVADMTRINRLMPTLRDLIANRARVIIMSHFGRPEGKYLPEMTLRPVAKVLSQALGYDVSFAGDCIGEVAVKAVARLQPGNILLLENLRYHAGEENNDPEFVKKLAALSDVYVNDGFSVAHRSHASTVGIAHILPAFAGRQMKAELEALWSVLDNPMPKVVAIIGGSKISTKLELLDNLVQKVDILMIGGGMANTFLNAQGVNVGKSLCEKNLAEIARGILEKANLVKCEIILPIDALVSTELEKEVRASVCDIKAVPANSMILDIGPATVRLLESKLAKCKTLIWNGPLGAFEIKPFDSVTNALSEVVANLTSAGDLVSVAGGGDTVSALNNAGVFDKLTYVSTAGGAFLEWLEGKELPGVKVLMGQTN